MQDKNEIGKPVSVGFDLGRWLGRREAFGLIAGRCSAAEAETLRRIRDEKLFRERARSWDEFCERELGASRRNINRVIRYLTEFGPQYFHVTQMTRITPQQYRSIAGHVDQSGINLDGEIVALLPENQQKVAGAVGELLQRSQQPAPLRQTPVFADALKRCESAADLLDALNDSLNISEQYQLAAVLRRMRLTACRFGVFFDR